MYFYNKVVARAQHNPKCVWVGLNVWAVIYALAKVVTGSIVSL